MIEKLHKRLGISYLFVNTNTVLSARDAIKSSPGISLELERLRLLSRKQLAETLAQSAAELKGLKEELRGAELENRYLRELLRLARIEKYGPGSEKLSEEQTDAFRAGARSESGRSRSRERTSTTQAPASSRQ